MYVEKESFIDHYIQPLIDSPLSELAYSASIEIVKILAAVIFLDMAGRVFLKQSRKWTYGKISEDIIVAPLLEEIFFRGLLQRGIQALQYVYHNEEEPMEEQKFFQQAFRVHTTALIFGLAHLLNGNDFKGSLIQCSWSYIGGVIYGHLSEKYNTLSLAILAHGINNGMWVAQQQAPPQMSIYFFVAFLVNKLSIYRFFVRDQDAYLIAAVNRTVGFCSAVRGYVLNFFDSKQDEVNAVLDHPVFYYTYITVAETVKVVAATIFLDLIFRLSFKGDVEVLSYSIYHVMVTVPLVEEILFRGILQQGIHYCQHALGKMGYLEEEATKAQRVFRVIFSGVIFGSLHFFLPHHKTLSSAISQSALGTLMGIICGELSERYQTSALGVIGHGLNNGIALAIFHPEVFKVEDLLRAAYLANFIGLAIFAFSSIDLPFYSVLSQLANDCIAVPKYLMKQILPQQPE